MTYPVFLIEIKEVNCHALTDAGAGASYASTTLISHVNKKPIHPKINEIETLMSTNTRKIKLYSVKIQDITELNHLEKEVSLKLLNPKYRELENTYVHLKDLQINDHDPKNELPVHVILCISDYTKIKTRPRVGLRGAPLAE